MEINSNEELIEVIGEGLLWDIVGDYIESDVKHIQTEISKLAYIELDNIQKITSAEVLDSEEFVITEFLEKNGILNIEFEMPAIIIAGSENEDVCFRITTVCTGTVEIPDIDSYDRQSIDFEDMNKDEILSYSDLVKIINVSYEDTEADDLTA